MLFRSKTANDEDIPDRDTADGTSVAIARYTDCRDGAEVLFYRVIGGGHRLPRLDDDPAPQPPYGHGNRDIDTAEVTWDFFKRFSLP